MNWAMRKTVERRATRMHQMMDRLQVDARVLVCLRSGEAYAEARWRCLRCEESCMCLYWLDKGIPDVRPDFCPNLEFFNACKMLSQRLSPAQSGASEVLLAMS